MARARKTETHLKVRHAFTGEHPQDVVSQLDKPTKTSRAGQEAAANQTDLRGSVCLSALLITTALIITTMS